uniref:AbiH family protein n=1 Tax=Acinetobacter guillouiae TaxID=106649 RepID=UPI0028D5AAD0
MNILIVGNGFDLSHYLPTKYDHFMVAMDAIENWDELKGDMGFDDLFGFLYEKERANSNMRCDSFKSHMIIN